MAKAYSGALGTTHPKAKSLAAKYRAQGYGAFVKKSGKKTYVYRTESRKKKKS